jgi:tRNA-binding protein
MGAESEADVSETDYQTTRPAEIAYDDFANVEIRVGRILSAEPLAGARKPAYALRIDFGEPVGVKQSSAQVTVRYRAEELVGRLVLCVVNFPPRRIAGFKSEVLTLGVPDASGDVVLITPTADVPLGGRLY